MIARGLGRLWSRGELISRSFALSVMSVAFSMRRFACRVVRSGCGAGTFWGEPIRTITGSAFGRRLRSCAGCVLLLEIGANRAMARTMKRKQIVRHLLASMEAPPLPAPQAVPAARSRGRGRRKGAAPQAPLVRYVLDWHLVCVAELCWWVRSRGGAHFMDDRRRTCRAIFLAARSRGVVPVHADWS